MDLGYIDNLAYNGKSLMHRASTPVKVALVVVVLGVVVTSQEPRELAGVFLVLGTVFWLSGLPWKELFSLLAYPVLFSLAFALSRLEAGFPVFFTVIAKAATAALGLILLVSTTPYIEVFSLLALVLPQILIDALYLTYRSLFILLGQMSSFVTILHLKAGLAPWTLLRNARSIGGVLGVMFLHSLKMSERMYDVMMLRGYGTGVYFRSTPPRLNSEDWFPCAFMVVILMVVWFL